MKSSLHFEDVKMNYKKILTRMVDQEILKEVYYDILNLLFDMEGISGLKFIDKRLKIAGVDGTIFYGTLFYDLWYDGNMTKLKILMFHLFKQKDVTYLLRINYRENNKNNQEEDFIFLTFKEYMSECYRIYLYHLLRINF